MATYQALEYARERGLDLVEVAPTSDPPVCRILDFGKFKYEQSKRDREAKKHQKQVVLREVRMKAKIDDHDVEFKTRIVEKLLGAGDKVKVSVMFRGREITHPEIGRELLVRIHNQVKDASVVEKPPGLEGRFMTMILAPGAPKKPPREAAKDGEPQDEEAPDAAVAEAIAIAAAEAAETPAADATEADLAAQPQA